MGIFTTKKKTYKLDNLTPNELAFFGAVLTQWRMRAEKDGKLTKDFQDLSAGMMDKVNEEQTKSMNDNGGNSHTFGDLEGNEYLESQMRECMEFFSVDFIKNLEEIKKMLEDKNGFKF